MLIETKTDDLETEKRLRDLRYTPEELEALLPKSVPPSLDEWLDSVEPASPEEIADTEEFLAHLERERQASVGRDLGLEH